MNRWWLAGFVCLGLFACDDGAEADAGPDAGLTAGYFEVEVEPNDTRATAQSVPTGASVITFVDASINPSGDVDVYALQIPTGGPYTLQARTYAIAGPPSSCGGIDTTLAVFAGSGASLGSNDDYNGTSCSEVITAVPSGTVYVEVRAFVGTISQYHLELVVQ